MDGQGQDVRELVDLHAALFWSNFLSDTAWQLYLFLRLQSGKENENGWGPLLEYRSSHLAEALGRDKKMIIGRPDYPGALQQLVNVGAVQCNREGHGPYTTYKIRVLAQLPPLTKEQTGKLRAPLQEILGLWEGYDGEL